MTATTDRAEAKLPAVPRTGSGLLTRIVESADPRLLAVAGGLCVSASSLLVKLSGTSAGTSVFFRCLLALPLLIPLALAERRREGRQPVLLPLIAGALLGVDLVCWAEAIGAVGAGIATVLVAVQVVIVPGLAFAFLGERPGRRYLFAVPVLLGGIVLAGGVADPSAFGPAPLYGTVTGVVAGIAYAGYLLLLRRGTKPGGQVRSVCLATVSAGAVAVAVGAPWHGVDLAPGWAAFGWLVALAVCGQAVGWLLVGAALPRLSSSTGATLMLMQPIGAVVLGVLLLGEAPSALQLSGCAAVVGAACFVSMRRR
ncbi:DMT family transporter [Amycolatopsis minnesotensis]|uniref:DMT family transporter n=1 Tax=Amycolatopsis minnesotensis TaxID=337894 RepID=A0ABN2Q5C4_9PSEU